MRTIVAPEDGTPLTLLQSAVCQRPKVPRVVVATIYPAPEEGAYPAGGLDAKGYGLHLAYTVASDDAVPHTTYPGVAEKESRRDIAVEFGPGTHWLNFPGELKLTGGKGLWDVEVQVLPAPFPWPHLHYLLRRVGEARTFKMPVGHTLIGCYNGSAVLLVDGVKLVVGATPVPAYGEIKVLSAGDTAEQVWLFTAAWL